LAPWTIPSLLESLPFSRSFKEDRMTSFVDVTNDELEAVEGGNPIVVMVVVYAIQNPVKVVAAVVAVVSAVNTAYNFAKGVFDGLTGH
jgi:hypothetical protein